jgi:hypothetical protein
MLLLFGSLFVVGDLMDNVEMIVVLPKACSIVIHREDVRTENASDRASPDFVGSSESNGDKGLKKGLSLQKDKEVLEEYVTRINHGQTLSIFQSCIIHRTGNKFGD